MTKRYYKASNGTFTIFRASERPYRTAWMTIDRIHVRDADGETWVKTGEPQPVNMGFSAGIGKIGDYQVTEIGKGEYQALVAAKTWRVEARVAALRAAGRTISGGAGSAPRDSWVRNEDLPKGLYVGPI